MFRLEKFYPQGFNPQRYWDDKYSQEHIAGKSSEEFRKQGFWPLLQNYLEKNKRYLDAGCGIGGWILFLKEEGYNVEGIDIAARTVRALTEYDPDLTVKVASITAIPYPDESLDGVLAIGTLEYVDGKVPDALREAHRVLRPGGIFFIEVPIISSLRRTFYIPLKRLEKLFKQGQGRKPTFSNYLFDHQELRHMLTAAGFKVLEVRPHELPEADSHYGLYVDWPFLRGEAPYKLNWLGRLLKDLANSWSLWVASTGMVVVARKE
jgi:SAM-dependent methyltransferase